ncbi:MAG: hypothetical protein ACRDNS_20795, partial [Trebonia sp.]
VQELPDPRLSGQVTNDQEADRAAVQVRREPVRGRRLGHQAFDRGDLLALTFDSAADEAGCAPRHGGLNVLHVIPEQAVADGDLYRGTLADETRLFYVAVTRAQKYLHLSFSPGAGTRQRKRSEFFDFATRYQHFLTAEPPSALRCESSHGLGTRFPT